MRPWFDDHTLWSDPSQTRTRACEHPGCAGEGSYRAPFSPQQLNRYRWFCLDHVREYNSRWDFAKGLEPDEIEQMVRFDTIWQRETRPLGDWRTKERLLRRFARQYAGSETATGPLSDAASSLPAKVVAALALLELDVVPPADILQSKYRDLVKKYHPDANGGDKMAEEKLKDINLAYAVLRVFIKQDPS